MSKTALLAALWLAAPAVGAPGPVHRTEENIPYREGGAADPACALDVHYPENGRDLPVIVWFHGGGLTEGSRTIPEELRNGGVVVVSPGYRLSTAVPVKTCIEDAAAALAWTFANAAHYGGSPDKIHLSGASAGGYLAAMVGLDKQYLAAHGLDPRRLAGLAPLTAQMITHVRARREDGVADTQPVIDDMAPLHHVRRDAPPVLLVTGDRELELLGRYEENAYFARMMKIAGHPQTELFEIRGHNHSEVIPVANRMLLRRVAAGGKENGARP